MKINVEIVQLEHASGLPLPQYATTGSAGVDLMAAISEEITIKPFARAMVPTGLKIALPEGYEAQVRPRSGLALKNGITVLNTPGTIDSDYRGEICVILANLSDTDFVITRGMRIAQMVIAQFNQCNWVSVNNLDSTERGEGGFGSTGTNQIKVA